MTIIPLSDSAEGTAFWHSLRAKHVGGSETAALWDLPRDKLPAYYPSRFSLWHIKAGNVPPPDVDNPRAKWGLRLEEAIAYAAAEQEGWSITKGGYASSDDTPGCGCTLDYAIASDPNEDGPGALELKNVDWLVHRRTWTDGEPPIHILLQLQNQLAATGWKWGAVGALIGGNELSVYRFQARPKIITQIHDRVTEFWASIREGREPPVDGTTASAEVLAALYPELVEDPALDLSANNEFPEAAHDFDFCAVRRRMANKAYEDAKNRLARLMEGHQRAFGGGWWVKATVTPANPGRLPKPGELVGKRKESRRYKAGESESVYSEEGVE